jgi:hypothetical protein
MNNYDNVKVGDELFYRVKTGIQRWRTVYFPGEFFISCNVQRVTKSQFVTESGRYRKTDGMVIGEGYNIYRKGDCPLWGLGRRTIAGCEREAKAEYEASLADISKAFGLQPDVSQVKCLERAKKVSGLLIQAQDLIDGKGEGS